MSSRAVTTVAGSVWVLLFVAARPEVASIGSDCEVLAAGLVREPVAAVSSLAIVAAGWFVARHRPAPGLAILLAGAASIAAHASAHPTARALDGILASVAGGAVVWSVLRERPSARRVGVGIGIAGSEKSDQGNGSQNA